MSEFDNCHVDWPGGGPEPHTTQWVTVTNDRTEEILAAIERLERKVKKLERRVKQNSEVEFHVVTELLRDG